MSITLESIRGISERESEPKPEPKAEAKPDEVVHENAIVKFWYDNSYYICIAVIVIIIIVLSYFAWKRFMTPEKKFIPPPPPQYSQQQIQPSPPTPQEQQNEEARMEMLQRQLINTTPKVAAVNPEEAVNTTTGVRAKPAKKVSKKKLQDLAAEVDDDTNEIHVTPAQLSQIKKLHKAKKSLADISRKTDIPVDTIEKILNAETE